MLKGILPSLAASIPEYIRKGFFFFFFFFFKPAENKWIPLIVGLRINYTSEDVNS